MAINPKLEAWEASLSGILKKIDEHLEDEYGERFTRHPARPARGVAANGQYDGLFRVSATFTAGFGTAHGKGYIIRVEIATLENVPERTRAKIEGEAEEMLRAELPKAFPGRRLELSRDESGLKIHGDLSLD